MANFRFRLESVLKLRERARDARREELAKAYQAVEILQQNQAEVHQELEQLRSQYKRAGETGALAVDQLLESQRFENILRSQLATIAKQMGILAEEVERRRIALMEADREVKVLEKLREHKKLEHTEQQQKQEMKQLDEVASRISRDDTVSFLK